jgi:hypothetical protein
MHTFVCILRLYVLFNLLRDVHATYMKPILSLLYEKKTIPLLQ